jgi:hypothetical protein
MHKRRWGKSVGFAARLQMVRRCRQADQGCRLADPRVGHDHQARLRPARMRGYEIGRPHDIMKNLGMGPITNSAARSMATVADRHTTQRARAEVDSAASRTVAADSQTVLGDRQNRAQAPRHQ